MRLIVFLLTALVLGTETPAQNPRIQTYTGTAAQVRTAQLEEGSMDSIVQFLINAAATDFHDHGPSGPLRFRDVRIGHVLTGDAENSYRLCDQFVQTQVGAKSQWTPFVTIKTSGYEQYIGSQAASFCQDSSFVWDTVDDLTSSLQSRFDSLR